MKNFGYSVALELAVGLLAFGVVLALAFAAPTQLSALTGVAAGLVVGLVALFTKSQVSGTDAEALRGTLKVQGVAFGLRLCGLGLGGLVMRRQGLEVEPFVLAFATLSLVQQVIEVRFLLTAQKSAVGAR